MLVCNGWEIEHHDPSAIKRPGVRWHSPSTHFVSLHDTFRVSYQHVQGNKLQREDVVCVAQLWEKMGWSCVKKHAATTTLHYVQHHVSNCFTRISFLTSKYFQHMFIIIIILPITQEITQLSHRHCCTFTRNDKWMNISGYHAATKIIPHTADMHSAGGYAAVNRLIRIR